MATLYQNITIDPKISSFKAINLQTSGSFNTELQVNTKGNLIYKPKKGSFIAQLKNFTPEGETGIGLNGGISPYEFFEGQVFGIPPFESYPEGEGLFQLDNSGESNNYKLAPLLPSTCIVQGVVYDNRMQYPTNGLNFVRSLYSLPTANVGPNSSQNLTNSIPFHYFINSYDGLISLTLPPPDPALSPDGLYNFVPGNLVYLRRAYEVFPGFWASTTNGFTGTVSSYTPGAGINNNHIITFYVEQGTANGSWSGSNYWIIQNPNPGVLVENGLESLLHFEFHHAIYPCNKFQNPTSLTDPATLATGNNIQGENTSNGTIAPSQLTYRKFWHQNSLPTDDLQAIYSNGFNGAVSISSPYNNNKAFTLYYNNSMKSWIVQGAFKRNANIIVRGTYQIY